MRVETQTVIAVSLTYDEAKNLVTVLDQIRWSSMPAQYATAAVDLNDLLSDIGVDSDGPLEDVELIDPEKDVL